MKIKLLPLIAIVALITTACDTPKPEPTPEPVQQTKNLSDKYAEYTLTTNISHLSEGELEMLGLLFEAADIMDNLRKYWKLPLVYGGFLGCLYAMNWNNTMYKDYSQAYLDLTDNDPATQSYNQFMHLGMQINDSNKDRYKDLFKKRKDRYRRWRDMSFFVLVGVYALSVIDAYVDAELSEFDISKDLSLRIEPTVLDTHTSKNPLDSAVGVQCSIKF